MFNFLPFFFSEIKDGLFLLFLARKRSLILVLRGYSNLYLILTNLKYKKNISKFDSDHFQYLGYRRFE